MTAIVAEVTSRVTFVEASAAHERLLDLRVVDGPPFDQASLAGQQMVAGGIMAHIMPLDDPVIGQSIPPQLVCGEPDLGFAHVESRAVTAGEGPDAVAVQA